MRDLPPGMTEELWSKALDAAKRGDVATADALADAARAVGRAQVLPPRPVPVPVPTYPRPWPYWNEAPYITWPINKVGSLRTLDTAGV